MSSRFVQADLAALGDVPDVVPVDFEAIRANRIALIVAAFAAVGIDYDVGTLETDPAIIVEAEAGGVADMNIRQRVNESARALSLAKARGGNLDHIAATYYQMLARAETVDGQGNVVLEDDERFRQRIALSPEAFSTAGPEGAYIFQALELDGVPDLADAAAYSEEDGATYSDGVIFADAFTAGNKPTPFANRAEGDPVLAPEVLVVVVPTVAYGPADQALVDRAFEAVTLDDVRPVGDCVRVEVAEVIDYSVEIIMTYARGADPTPLVDAARVAVGEYVAKRRRVGMAAEIHGIFGAAYISGIEAVDGILPLADVGGGSKQVPNCVSIEIVAVQSEGTWS